MQRSVTVFDVEAQDEWNVIWHHDDAVKSKDPSRLMSVAMPSNATPPKKGDKLVLHTVGLGGTLYAVSRGDDVLWDNLEALEKERAAWQRDREELTGKYHEVLEELTRLHTRYGPIIAILDAGVGFVQGVRQQLRNFRQASRAEAT